MHVGTGDVDLGEHRKTHVIGQRAELLDLLLAARLLPVEVVGRETQHFQSGVLLFAIELFQAFVLRGQAALGGGIDHQQHLAAVVAQRGRSAVDGGQRDVIHGSGHSGS